MYSLTTLPLHTHKCWFFCLPFHVSQIYPFTVNFYYIKSISLNTVGEVDTPNPQNNRRDVPLDLNKFSDEESYIEQLPSCDQL